MLARRNDVHVSRLTPEAASAPPPGLGPGADPAARSVPADRHADWLALSGWVCDLRAGRGAAVAAELAATLARLRALGLPVDRDRYDPVATLNLVKHAARAGQDESWARHFVPNGRRLILEHHDRPSPEAPPTPRGLPPRRFAVALSRTFHLAGIAPGTPLRLRLPLPLPRADLAGLVVEPSASDGVVLAVAPGRLDGRVVADGRDTLTLRADCRFVARPAPVAGAAEPPEPDIYTRPNEGPIQVTPRVRALAAKLAGDAAAPRLAVRAIWDHLLDRLSFGALHYHDIGSTPPTDWVLENGWSDCRLGSALLIALCRASGIPARLIAGHALYEACPFQHFWAEIWFAESGWAPFDLQFSWDLSAGGRDPAWRDHFMGVADYRITTQVFPRHFSGPMTIRLPPRWHVIALPEPEGISTVVSELASGRPVYTDTTVARRGDQVFEVGDIVNAGPL